jgi:hypothetical protein
MAEEIAGEQNTVEFTFDLTPDDFLAWARRWAERSPVLREQMRRSRVSAVLLLALIGPVLGLLFLLDGELAGFAFAVVASWIAAAVFWFMWPTRFRAAVRKNADKQMALENPAVFGSKRYAFDAQGLRFSGVHSGGYAYWTMVTDVDSDENGVYLGVSAASAHIIPARAFTSPAAMSEFAGQAGPWFAAARPQADTPA